MEIEVTPELRAAMEEAIRATLAEHEERMAAMTDRLLAVVADATRTIERLEALRATPGGRA